HREPYSLPLRQTRPNSVPVCEPRLRFRRVCRGVAPTRTCAIHQLFALLQTTRRISSLSLLLSGPSLFPSSIRRVVELGPELAEGLPLDHPRGEEFRCPVLPPRADFALSVQIQEMHW